MILGSIIALELKNILSAIIAISVVGLGVSIAFVFLQAPDLAIVQFLFEIFAMILLVRAFIHKDLHVLDRSPKSIFLNILTAAILIALFIASVPIFKLLPAFGEPLMTTAEYYLENGPHQTGAANIVASIILDYRAYDTLGEITVLFTAILGTFSVLRLKSRSSQKDGVKE
jgi:multisubunit Na+/H+ antiporter MnhB subunit